MRTFLVTFLTVILASTITAQKTSDAIKSQIKTLHAEKQLYLTFDGRSSKIMGIADNFDGSESKAAGLQAMNFGMAFFFNGTTLTESPATINLSFWAMAKKPRFSGGSHWIATIGGDTLDLGDSRYGPKPSENMEYLNFVLNREDLAKIAASPTPVKFKLGTYDFTFTASQMTLLKNIIAVSETK